MVKLHGVINISRPADTFAALSALPPTSSPFGFLLLSAASSAPAVRRLLARRCNGSTGSASAGSAGAAALAGAAGSVGLAGAAGSFGLAGAALAGVAGFAAIAGATGAAASAGKAGAAALAGAAGSAGWAGGAGSAALAGAVTAFSSSPIRVGKTSTLTAKRTFFFVLRLPWLGGASIAVGAMWWMDVRLATA